MQRREQRQHPALRQRDSEAAPAEVPSPRTWWTTINDRHHCDPSDQWNYVTPHQRKMMENCDKQFVRRGSGVPPSITNHDLVNKGLNTSGLVYRACGNKKFEVDVIGESIEIECDHKYVWTRWRVSDKSYRTLSYIFERLANPDIGWRQVQKGRGPPGSARPRRRRKTDAMLERQRERARARSRSRSRRRRTEAAPEEPSRRRRAEAAPAREPSASPSDSESSSSSSSSDSQKSPPPRPSGHRDESASSDRSPSLEAQAEAPEPEVRVTAEVRGRKATVDPTTHVAPTLFVEHDTNRLLEKEREAKWRTMMTDVYDRHPELVAPCFSTVNPKTGWRTCTLCRGREIGTGHEDSPSHLEKMRSAIVTMGDAELIAAMKVWLIVPDTMTVPQHYAGFCRVVGVDTVHKRLEIAEAKKALEMERQQKEIGVKREST